MVKEFQSSDRDDQARVWGYVMPSEQKRSESLRPPSRVLRNASRHSGALRLCVIGKYLSKFSLRYISGRHQLRVTQELVLGQRDQRFHSVTGSVLTISSLAWYDMPSLNRLRGLRRYCNESKEGRRNKECTSLSK